MEPVRHRLQTPGGEVWLWGAPDALTGPAPVVLVIDGAFAIPRPRTFELQSYLPEAVVLNAHLPGNHCPEVAEHSVEAYAAAYQAALDQIGRPAVVVGASVGALTAMAMRSPWIRGRVLLDPPLVTVKLWPLATFLRGRLAGLSPSDPIRRFIENIFGISEAGFAGRDYRPLVAGLDAPAWVLYGSAPLNPPRDFQEMPSLLDEPERALLAAHPKVQVRVIEGIGHNVAGRAITFVRTATRDLLTRFAGAAAVNTGEL